MRETQFGSCGAGKPRTFPLKRLNSQPRRRRSVSAFGNSVLREGKGALERRQGQRPAGSVGTGPTERPCAAPRSASRARIVSLCPAWGVSWSRRW